MNLPWNNLDWQGLSTIEQQQQLKKLLQTQREQGFQFNQAPLMECTLIQLGEDNYQFIWSHHHILMDGWCSSIIFKEVLSFYEAEVRGETCYLPTPRPYRDYIAWLNSQDQEAALDFWRQTLQGFSAPTPLVVDKTQYQNQQQQGSDYQELELRLSTRVSRKLQSVAQQHHLTLSTIVQAAWALLLSRYSGEKDVVFGVTISGRPASLSGVEEMVGLLINTLPLRLQISPQQQLIHWLQQIQQLMLELQDYSYTPLVDIQSMSEVPGGIPLFESIVVFENYPFDSSLFNEDSSLQFGQIEGFEQTNYPLTVAVMPGDELLVKISYDTVRFESDTIERMLGHLQTIFSAIVADPQQRVAQLPLLSEAEQHQLLVEWNNTQTEYSSNTCIHQLFEAQVERTPDAVAVVFGERSLTYQELNARANQLGHHLQALGVGSETLVGICVERSLDLVVGLLGILKAGGAYVPLDPAYPKERLAYMLSDSQLPVLLTQEKLVAELPEHGAGVVCLDTDWGRISQESEENPVSGVKPENLAYVIYTSGSTGRPKGVLIPHQGLVNHSSAIIQQYSLTANDRVLQFATFSFDVAAEEIFPSWSSGATLVLRPAEMPASLSDFTKFVERESLTVLNLPTPYWQEWVLELSQWESTLPKSLRLVVVGSETVLLERLVVWQQHVGARVSWRNAYGPTETTITATVYQPAIGLGQEKVNSVPIGRPIANTQVYILDSHLQPVPIGVPGELYIGGLGLARGYLNRPELTEKKFIRSPFGDRLYKTGDLVRYLPDGNIEFLGRIDNQVKIRGFRIELGEIEAVLAEHPGVTQVAVIAREDQPGNKRLVAYVLLNPEQEATSSELRRFLKEKLPDYMVPAAFVELEELPLTPNGKVDRRALPAPDLSRSGLKECFVAPRTATEEVLAGIWAEVLGIERGHVGIYNSFFELGGHSLLATQVASRIRQAFQVELPLRSFFEEPTVAVLAEYIEMSRWTVQELEVSATAIEGDIEEGEL